MFNDKKKKAIMNPQNITALNSNEKRFIVKGSECGRGKDGVFHCECGECEELLKISEN